METQAKESQVYGNNVVWLIVVFLIIRILWLVLSAYTMAAIDITEPLIYLEKEPGKFVSQADPQHGLVEEFIFSGWSRWDSSFFLKIAMKGYAVEDGTTAFAPIYPLLIRTFALFTGHNYVFAALLISNFFALVSVLLLWRTLMQETRNSKTAFRVVLLFLSFPTTFFLFAAYPESIFLTFLFLSWSFARQGKWFLAACAGAVATLIRFQGITITVMLFGYYFFRDNLETLYAGMVNTTKIKQLLRDMYKPLPKIGFPRSNLIYLFLPVSAYLSYQYWATNQFGHIAVKTYEVAWQNPLLKPWNAVYYLVIRLCNGNLYLMDYVNLMMVVLFGFLAIDGLRKLHPALSLYSLVTLFVTAWITLGRLSVQPQDGQVFTSFVRYALSLFPLFIILESWLKKPSVFIMVVIVFLLTQAAFLWLFIQWYFIA